MTEYNKKLKQARNRADKIWSETAIKLHPRCEYCGVRENLQAHHFIPRSLSSALRFDLKNAVVLCSRHHWLWHNRADGEIYAKIVLGRGQKWADYIKRKRKKMVKLTLGWYEKQIKSLQAK